MRKSNYFHNGHRFIYKRIHTFFIIIILCLLALACRTEEDDDDVIPIAPTTLIANAASSSQIDLAWIDKSDNEDGFRIEYKNIKERFLVFQGWFERSDVYKIKFEDLVSQNRGCTFNKMAEYCSGFSPQWQDIEQLTKGFEEGMNPKRSHTFNRGESGIWKQKFTAEHCYLMKEVAGDLLIQLGYEKDKKWEVST